MGRRLASSASSKSETMNDERCQCGRPKGHAPPTYKAPSFVVEYPDGRKVQTSVATRWNSQAARDHGMPEVSPRNEAIVVQNEPVQQNAVEISTAPVAKEEPKPRKTPAKRAAKAPKTPEGQGSLF